jgi:hypothetical protein
MALIPAMDLHGPATDHQGVSAWYSSDSARDWSAPAAGALEFHRSLPGYAPTPLIDVPAPAAELGVGQVLVKDESARLGLPAFKVLGASWACQQVQNRTPCVRLIAATDGNHGRADLAQLERSVGQAPEVQQPGRRRAHLQAGSPCSAPSSTRMRCSALRLPASSTHNACTSQPSRLAARPVNTATQTSTTLVATGPPAVAATAGSWGPCRIDLFRAVAISASSSGPVPGAAVA